MMQKAYSVKIVLMARWQFDVEYNGVAGGFTRSQCAPTAVDSYSNNSNLEYL